MLKMRIVPTLNTFASFVLMIGLCGWVATNTPTGVVEYSLMFIMLSATIVSSSWCVLELIP